MGGILVLFPCSVNDEAAHGPCVSSLVPITVDGIGFRLEDVRSRISGSGEGYDSRLMIGMNVMKGSEVCMQIGNEVLCATLGAHCGGWRNLV